ncbi:MAG: DNA polymerase III subunit gamma/tau [Actinomycetota bacterium]|nr:DNA polymerase III subunit gamma/tau [Actinomycetota bacterium]
MAYQSLYRRYRPQRFSEVVGQKDVVAALRNAVREERTSHAYLFSGPRGTGKTSIARILAKALNCTDLQDGDPCGVCEACVAIEAGTSFDLHELDAASNNGVDDVRDLLSKAALGTPGRTKVYILDEVHMLSQAASNALLKGLEEPPDHVTFVLATTDPQKVIPTVRSRTQRQYFGLIDAADLEAHIRWVIDDAQLDVGDDGVAWALRRGGGSARDTLSALEQVASVGGVPAGDEPVDDLLDALVARDTGAALAAVATAVGSGSEPRVLADALLGRLRDAFLASMGTAMDHLPAVERERAAAVASGLGAAGITRALEVVGEALLDMRQAPDPRISLEVAVVRLTRTELSTDTAALLERIERLEQALSAGAPLPPQAGGGADAGSTSPASSTASPSTPAPAAAAPSADGDGDAGPPPEDASPRSGPPADEPATRPPSRPERQAPPERAPAEPDRPAASPAASAPAASPVKEGPAAAARRRLEEKRRQAGAAAPQERAPRAGRGQAGPPQQDASPSRPPERRPAAGPSTDGRGDPPVEEATPAGGAPSADTAPAAGTAPASEPRSAAGAGSAPSDASGIPGLDELVGAWPAVLEGLAKKAKARFAQGRFVGVDERAARYALPNEVHKGRCEELRSEVEAALGSHFGRRVPLALVVDEAPPPREDDPGWQPEPSAAEEPADGGYEDVGDIAELEDATDVSSSAIDRLLAGFPGAQLVEEEG